MIMPSLNNISTKAKYDGIRALRGVLKGIEATDGSTDIDAIWAAYLM